MERNGLRLGRGMAIRESCNEMRGQIFVSLVPVGACTGRGQQ
jgi:hypothetical protein